MVTDPRRTLPPAALPPRSLKLPALLLFSARGVTGALEDGWAGAAGAMGPVGSREGMSRQGEGQEGRRVHEGATQSVTMGSAVCARGVVTLCRGKAGVLGEG